MATRFGFGGKASVDEDLMKGRYVVGGGYKGRNNHRDILDKFGKVKDFLDHDDTEMIVPPNLSRPGPNMATRPSWPKLPPFGQRMMLKKEDDDKKEIPGFNDQESFTPADKAEDSSKKPNNFWQDQEYVDPILVPNNRGGSNPYPNNNVTKPTNYRGTAMEPPKDDKQSYGVNNNSSNEEDNFNKVKESEELPKFPNKKPNMSSVNSYTMDQGPKQHSDIMNQDRKQHSDTMNQGPKQHSDYASDGISITHDLPSKHKINDFSNTNGKDQEDESKKNNITPPLRTFVSNKPNIRKGWQERYYYNGAHRWQEITPNPPPQLRYGGVYPNLRPVYRRAVIDSKWAEKKYNGVLIAE